MFLLWGKNQSESKWNKIKALRWTHCRTEAEHFIWCKSESRRAPSIQLSWRAFTLERTTPTPHTPPLREPRALEQTTHTHPGKMLNHTSGPFIIARSTPPHHPPTPESFTGTGDGWCANGTVWREVIWVQLRAFKNHRFSSWPCLLICGGQNLYSPKTSLLSHTLDRAVWNNMRVPKR